MTLMSHFRTIALGALLAVLLAACAGDDENIAGPFRVEFEDAQRRATSDFERSVLEDAKISRAEYEEAVGRFIKCMKDGGIEAEALPAERGNYQYRWPKEQNNDESEKACRTGSTLLIEPLYNEILINPNNEDPFELQVRCLIRESLVPADYTADDLKAAIRSDYVNAPFDRDDPKVIECMAGRS